MLTIVQDRWYWAAWRPCYEALRRHGMPRARALEHRRHIQHKAVGRDVSHRELDEIELRKTLAAFNAFSRARRPHFPHPHPLTLVG